MRHSPFLPCPGHRLGGHALNLDVFNVSILEDSRGWFPLSNTVPSVTRRRDTNRRERVINRIQTHPLAPKLHTDSENTGSSLNVTATGRAEPLHLSLSLGFRLRVTLQWDYSHSIFLWKGSMYYYYYYFFTCKGWFWFGFWLTPQSFWLCWFNVLISLCRWGG